MRAKVHKYKIVQNDMSKIYHKVDGYGLLLPKKVI